MLNMIYSDLHRIIKSRGLITGVATVAGYNLFFAIILKAVLLFIDSDLSSDDVVTAFSGAAPFVIAATVLYVFIGAFNDGTIRNRLLSGSGRKNVAASMIITGSMLSGILSIVSTVSALIIAVIFTKGFSSMTAADVAEYSLISAMACMAAGAFCSMLIVIFGGNKAASYSGLALTFIFKLISTEVADKLYPETGISLLKGTKLLVYNFYDRYFTYAHFSSMVRHPFSSYVIGNAALIAVSLIAGVLIFSKKEIK